VFLSFFVTVHVEGGLKCCTIFFVMCYCIVFYCIVLYCVVLYCPVLHCSTLPLGIKQFAVIIIIIIMCIKCVLEFFCNCTRRGWSWVLYDIFCDVCYCIVLYCTVLYCSTLPPGTKPFAVITTTIRKATDTITDSAVGPPSSPSPSPRR
jgi:hypothetical protein